MFLIDDMESMGFQDYPDSPREEKKEKDKVTIDEISEVEELEELEKSNRRIILTFGSRTCGPCKTFKPKLRKHLKENPKVKFIYADSDVAEELSEMYNITSLPTSVFIKRGKKIGTMRGIDEKKFDSLLELLKEKSK